MHRKPKVGGGTRNVSLPSNFISLQHIKIQGERRGERKMRYQRNQCEFMLANFMCQINTFTLAGGWMEHGSALKENKQL
jgi:hypothetical protein